MAIDIEAYQRELKEINRKTATIKGDLEREKFIFSDTKSMIDKKQEEIQKLRIECESLSH